MSGTVAIGSEWFPMVIGSFTLNQTPVGSIWGSVLVIRVV
jgi:hypothetical protein